MAKMKSGGKHSLKKGLSNKSPAAPSDKAKGANINSGALRTGPAATPRSLGPRTA